MEIFLLSLISDFYVSRETIEYELKNNM